MFLLSVDEANRRLGLPKPSLARRSIREEIERDDGVIWPFAPEYAPRDIAVDLVDCIWPYERAYVCLHGCGIFGWTEDLNLYERFCLSLETRPNIFGTPVHVFRPHHGAHLVSLLFMALAFAWDATIYAQGDGEFFELNHDGFALFETEEREILARLRRLDQERLIDPGELH